MELTISLAQTNIIQADPVQNLAAARDWAAQATAAGSQLILFPELWTTGYDLPHAQTAASSLGQGVFQPIAQIARETGLWVGGSCLESIPERVYNTFTLFDPQGNLAGTYRKLHLFRLMDEDHWLAAGDSPTLLELPWGKTGLAICYDLRFPELFRGYAIDGATLILLCAEWPASRADHWRTLLRARAIENQCFLAAVNRVGETDGERFGGGSLIVDPWGQVVAEAGDGQALLTAHIDLDQVAEVRRHIPVFQDRRPEIYHPGC